MEKILFVHKGVQTPLPIQAMLTAVANVCKILTSAVSLDALEDSVLSHLLSKTSKLCLYDILPTALPKLLLEEFSRCHRVVWLYSAQFSADFSVSLERWHQNTGIACWSEGGGFLRRQVPTASTIIFPPIRIEDDSPFNPLRRDMRKTRICVPAPPISDGQIRELQKEFLAKRQCYLLSVLRPAADMRDLCERFYGVDIHYIPGDKGDAQWNFDLSCLLTAGAMVCGRVPDLIRPFCREASSLEDAAASRGLSVQRRRIRYDIDIETVLINNFVETLTTAMEMT